MDEEPTRHLGIRLPLTIDRRLAALARREGNSNSVSATVRRLLSKALDAEEAENRPAKRGA